MGSTQVMYIPGETCRFLFDDGLDPREYVLDLDALPIQRGNVHVYETSSGTWPILRGGVARRGIDGNILWSTEMTYEPGYEVLMDAPVFDGTTLSIHYLETWQGATAGKTVAYSLHGKTLVVDVTADGGIAPGNGSYAALDVGRTIMEDPRSVLLPYNSEPVLVGDGIFVSKYADLTVSHGNTIWAAGPILDPWLGPGIRHPHYPAYLPDSAGMVQPLRERLYITVSANVEDVFVASDVVAGPGRDQLAARVVYDTWGVDESPLRRSPFSTPFHEQLLHFQRLATAFGMTEMQVLRHN
jgi:hypothetical protein